MSIKYRNQWSQMSGRIKFIISSGYIYQVKIFLVGPFFLNRSMPNAVGVLVQITLDERQSHQKM